MDTYSLIVFFFVNVCNLRGQFCLFDNYLINVVGEIGSLSPITKTKTLIALREKRSYFRFANFTRRIVRHRNGNYAYNNYYLPPLRDHQANKPIILLAAAINTLDEPAFTVVLRSSRKVRFERRETRITKYKQMCLRALGFGSVAFCRSIAGFFGLPVRSVSWKTFTDNKKRQFVSTRTTFTFTFLHSGRMLKNARRSRHHASFNIL